MAAQKKSNPVRNLQVSDALSFHLGRAYYNYVGCLQRLLVRFKLDKVLRPGMGGILFALFEKDGCIIKDLCEKLELSPSTLTPMIRRMEKAGIVSCRRCSGDGRAVRISLTAKGRGLEPRCLELSKELNALLVRNLTVEQVSSLKTSLAQVTENSRIEMEKSV